MRKIYTLPQFQEIMGDSSFTNAFNNYYKFQYNFSTPQTLHKNKCSREEK